MDRLKNRMPLPARTIPAGETLRLAVQPPVQLGNSGGLITVIDPAGLKVDGVSYTKQQAAEAGLDDRVLTLAPVNRAPGCDRPIIGPDPASAEPAGRRPPAPPTG